MELAENICAYLMFVESNVYFRWCVERVSTCWICRSEGNSHNDDSCEYLLSLWVF